MLNIVLLLIIFIVSLVILLKGADSLVDGAADLARYMKISAVIVGLTVVALGTSLPEFIVSFISVLTGSSDLAIGNVIGSNIANIGLVLGVCAIICPLVIRSSTLINEFPFMIVSSFVFIILANNMFIFNQGTLSIDWYDALILVIILGFFLYYVFNSIKRKKDTTQKEFKKEYKNKNPLWKNIILILVGIVMLILGGRLFVFSSTGIATLFGVSEGFIGLTLVALGTSLPELFASGVAAWKKETDIAIGNVVGSNIFNILFVLGISGLFKPITMTHSLLFTDAIIMIVFTLMFLVFATVSRKIERWQGSILLLMYLSYMVYLFLAL